MEDDDRDDRRDEPRDSGDNGNNGGRSAEEGTKIYIGNLSYSVRYHRLYYIFSISLNLIRYMILNDRSLCLLHT